MTEGRTESVSLCVRSPHWCSQRGTGALSQLHGPILNHSGPQPTANQITPVLLVPSQGQLSNGNHDKKMFETNVQILSVACTVDRLRITEAR